MVVKLVEIKKNQYEPVRYAVKMSDIEGKNSGDKQTIQDYLNRMQS